MTRKPEVPKQAPPLDAGGAAPRGDASDFEELFNHLPDPAFIFDKASLRYLAVNEAAIQRYGWSRGEFLEMTILDIRPEADREAFLEQVSAFPPQRRVNGEWRHRTKDGAEFAVDAHARDIRFQRRDCRLAIVQDAFERKMAWQALQETQEIYSDLVENLSEGIAILDEEGRFLFVNSACGQIFGVPPEGLLGRTTLDLVAPEAREFHAEQLRRRSKGDKDSYELEVIRADGARRWLAIRATPRMDSSKRFAGSVASFFDITQHRLALEALQQSESRFRRLVEMLPQGLVTYQDGKVTYSNPAASAITRTDPDKAVGRSILEYIHPTYWPAIKERFARMLAGEAVPPMDYTFRRGDGTEVPIEAHAQILEEGERPVMISVFTDLTHRMEMERAVRESEERFRLISQQTGQLIYDFDIATGLARWAGPMQAMLGLEDGLVIDVMAWGKRVHPEDHDREYGNLMRGIETLQPVLTEYRIRREDGVYIPVEDHGVFLPGTDGKAARMVGTVRDISERYAAAQAVRESEERYRSVIEQAQDMIFLVDLDTRSIIQANQSFHRILGYAPSALPGLSLYALVEGSKDSVDRNLGLVSKGGNAAIGRRVYRHADGTTRDVEVTGSMLRSGGQNIMVAMARDISERLATERALQQSQKLESLGILAGGIAHDFNNLLTAMMGNLSLAQLKSHASSPSWPYLDALEKTLQKAADLTRQMLAYSGKGRFVTKVVDLNEAVEEMTHLLSVSISKNISLRFDLGKGLPPLEADPVQLQQVVMNLVTNASDAIGDKEGAIRIATSLVELEPGRIAQDFPSQAVEPGPHLILEVTDTGCGMDGVTLQRIFEPFFTTKVKGRGLGLSAMLGILRGHRAGIRITSTPGQGTAFRIYFPAKTGAVAEEPALAPSLDLQPSGAALVVDDEPGIRESAVELLRILGFSTVFEASDGAEALEIFKARSREISLVFMDLTMPRMNGREAFRALRAIDPAIPVILSSGFDEEAGLAGDERPSAFLQKPYRFAQLRSTVMQALHKGEPGA
ncbi:MAG TPA: PAS domain S-box protein [Holophagaceae bacterium]|nr:PAS domain S-box protein [Holophagaceae bacterium]